MRFILGQKVSIVKGEFAGHDGMIIRRGSRCMVAVLTLAVALPTVEVRDSALQEIPC